MATRGRKPADSFTGRIAGTRSEAEVERMLDYYDEIIEELTLLEDDDTATVDMLRAVLDKPVPEVSSALVSEAPQAEETDDSEDNDGLEKPKDPWFDQWLIASGTPLVLLFGRMLIALNKYEIEHKIRKRERRANDQKRFRAMVEVLVCNLAYESILPSKTGRLAIGMRKVDRLTRYDNRDLSKVVMAQIFEHMTALGFMVVKRGDATTGVTTISPTQRFKDKVKEVGVTFSHFGRNEAEEVVILNRKAVMQTEQGPRKISRWVDYKDCAEADAIREQVRSINQFLKSADIAFVDDGQKPAVDPLNRLLRRNFTVQGQAPEQFNQTGRLYGGWWQNLKRFRRKHIRIQGEPVAELDFSSMFAHLAYVSVGAAPPEGDLYDMTGYIVGYDNEVHRDGIKKLFNALLNGAGNRLPREFKEPLPKGYRMPSIKRAMGEKHPPIAHLFGSSAGVGFMYTESEILLRVIESLKSKGVVCLGLHDAVLVPLSAADAAKEVMEKAALEVAGIAIPVKRKDHLSQQL